MKQITTLLILNFLLLTGFSQHSENITAKQQNKIEIQKGEPVTDIDGNVYETVIIGKQTWMKENLRVTRFINGDSIPTTNPSDLKIEPLYSELLRSRDFSVPPFASDGVTSVEKPVYQWCYNGDEENAKNYGRLYTWAAANDERDVCPEGWHIPTDKEWKELIEYLGGNALAGGKLKEKGTIHWAEPNVGATNESGFNALPGGERDVDGTFNNIGKFGAWWTSKQGLYRHIEHDDPYTFRNYYYSSMYYGFSVRCIKD